VAELGGALLLEVLGFKHESDLGGCFGYIRAYAEQEKIGVTEASMKVLDRTCAAVALILDTAEQSKQHSNTAPIAPADDLELFEDRFEVKVGSKRLVHYYLDAPVARTEVSGMRQFDEAAARRQISDMTPEERIKFAALLNSMMK